MVSLLLVNAIHMAWYVQEEWLGQEDVATATAPTLLHKAEADADFYGDVLLVVQLVLKLRQGPGIPIPQPHGWHGALADDHLCRTGQAESEYFMTQYVLRRLSLLPCAVLFCVLVVPSTGYASSQGAPVTPQDPFTQRRCAAPLGRL